MSAEIVNLRKVRKRRKRRNGEDEAAAQRVAHGTPKVLRHEIKAQRAKAARDLDGHRLDQDGE